MPIVWHVIQLYAAQGFARFLLATGYKGELIERFVAEHDWPAGVSVECVDTGLDTQTGGRIKLLEPRSRARRRFCATYADGVADIDLQALLDFHDEPRRARDDDRRAPRAAVRRHRAGARRARAGAFARSRARSTGSTAASSASRRAVLDYLERDSVLEREPLERLAPRTASCARTATRASGSAWTPTRTPSRSTTCGPPATAPWRGGGSSARYGARGC